MADQRRGDARFYSLGDTKYFVGAVALVNSLRIVGHDEHIVFLDVGLTARQRAILGERCEIVDLEMPAATHPFTLQPYPAAIDAHGVSVVLDSDMIVTRPLGGLLEHARSGRVVTFPDQIDRCVGEWQQIFSLGAPLRPGLRYVNSGFVAFDADAQRGFLDRWWSLCRELDTARSSNRDSPTRYFDQDVLNALLMSEFVDARLSLEYPTMVLGSEALAATRVESVEQLRCTRNGVPVAVLHTVAHPKPWEDSARYMLRSNAYLRCLRRCLTGPALAIRLEPDLLPPWLRPGAHRELERTALQAFFRLRQHAYRARVRFLSR